MRSKRKVSLRRLSSSSRSSLSSFESEEDDSGGYEGEVESRRGVHGCRRNTDAIGQSCCVPSDGYFDLYFEVIRTQVHVMIVPMVGRIDQRFKCEWGYLQ